MHPKNCVERPLLMLFVAAAIASGNRAAQGQCANCFVWRQPAFGLYASGSSWNNGNGNPPGPNDCALFGATLTTTFNPITVLYLVDTMASGHQITTGNYTYQFGNPNITLALTGDLPNPPINSGDLRVGDRISTFDPGLSPAARLTLDFNGSLTAHGLCVGWGCCGLGSRPSTVNINGPTTRVLTRVGTVIGGAIPNTGKSDSHVNITGGASFRTADVGGGNYLNGAVVVDGANSRWDNNGQLSMGGPLGTPATLTMTNGGYGRVGFIAIIGGDENGPAEVLVDGTGSIFDVTAGIWLGNNTGTGTGLMHVTNGGRVQVDSDISVGRGGSAGTFLVDNGGRAQSGFGFVGLFPGAPGVATITGTGSRWDMSSSGVLIGAQVAGRMDVLDGGTVMCMGGSTVGDSVGVAGTLIVRGAGSRFVAAGGELNVGHNSGNGTVTVDQGGQLVTGNPGDAGADANVGRDAASVGAVLVTGAGSSWQVGDSLTIAVAGTAQGTVTVESGATLAAGGGISLGAFDNASGLLTIRGAGSQAVAAGAVSIGERHNSTLLIEQGGTLHTGGYAWIGHLENAVATATVRDPGSLWTIAAGQALNVGSSNTADGTLIVASGGRVQVDGFGMYVADFDESKGHVVVRGAGSQVTVAGDTAIGQRDDGTLLVEQAGQVLTGGNSFVGNLEDAAGVATVQDPGSVWRTTGSLTIANAGAAATSGTLTVAHGGMVESRNVSLSGPAARLQGDGTIRITGGSPFDFLVNTGTVAPGAVGTNSTGTLSVDGPYFQGNASPGTPAGVLAIELAGTSSGQFDRLTVTDSAALGGRLAISLIDGFSPSVGQAFTILTAPAVFGTFQSVTGQQLGGGRFFRVVYSSTAVTLVVSECTADVNHDGVVNSQDFFDFLSAFFTSAPAADFNRDGTVNSQDFFDFLAAFFAGCP